MNCPQCGNPYAPGNRFCGNCGYDLSNAAIEPVAPQAPITPEAAPEPPQPTEQPPSPEPPRVTCPRCFHPNEPDSAFCFACGVPLQAANVQEMGARRLAAFELGGPGGFWFRTIAYLIDTLVIVLPSVFLWLLLGQPTPEDFSQIMEPPEGYERLQFLVIILTLIYDTALITFWATTVGKRAFGLYVVRSDGSRVGLFRALARHILTALSANLTLGLIFLVVAFREDRRGLHDLICDTVVIQRHRQRQPEHPYSDVR